MLAVIKTGGKQYKIRVGDKIKVEKLEGEIGSSVFFDEVLLTENENEVKIGNPLVSGVRIEGKILNTAKGKKVTGIKHKAKKRYKKKFGHRQIMTEVEIVSL